MPFYPPEEMKELFREFPQYKSRLYCRGFLVSTANLDVTDEYPFYGNWSKQTIAAGSAHYFIYTHYETYSYTYFDGQHTHYLIGHAYDPFTMVVDENEILHRLSSAMKNGQDAYWNAVSNLTGVFSLGYFSENGIIYSTDCCGMQVTYRGVLNGNLYLTSHSKLVADLFDLRQPKYIQKLVSNRFWHYFGTWLPGDLSPFDELKRLTPNFYGRYDLKTCNDTVTRYYPTHKISETTTDEEFKNTIHWLGNVMSNTMTCIARKWPEKKVSISVTGGRDSMTALSCTNGNYDKFSYFSYISNADEAIDADASKNILANLGLKRELYTIPDNYEEYKNIDAFKKVMECNAGCIGANNANDVKKRLYLWRNPPCDMEVKSWVNEIGRGWYQNMFMKRNFPKRPSPSFLRALHKVYLNPWLIHHTDKIFSDYIKKYYGDDVWDKLYWLELHFWEFSWGGAEALFLTSEHRVSYDITIPFNNRRYVERMLTVPESERITDGIPRALISYMEPRIADTGIAIKDVSHTDTRARIVRTYLEIFSRIHL